MSVVAPGGRSLAGVFGSIQRWVATYRCLVDPYTVCASVITPSESCCQRPLSRFSVTIESIPRPENTGGRPTRPHGTKERVRRLPVTFETKRERGSQPRALLAVAVCVYASGVEFRTTRTVPPFWRAAANEPSNVSVRETFMADGSLTSISVRTVLP